MLEGAYLIVSFQTAEPPCTEIWGKYPAFILKSLQKARYAPHPAGHSFNTFSRKYDDEEYEYYYHYRLLLLLLFRGSGRMWPSGRKHP